MPTHIDKKQESEIQSASSANAQKSSNRESSFQFVDNRPEAVTQRKLKEIATNSPKLAQLKAFQQVTTNNTHTKHTAQLKILADNHTGLDQVPIQKKDNTELSQKENNTGLPDNLKSGIENLSGLSMDDVKVHYNSDKPAQLQAHAYAQGSDIHIASGQEKHLAHEAWHVVQQKQGRVKPTTQLKGSVNVNDDIILEKEADVMGETALQKKSHINNDPLTNNKTSNISEPHLQMMSKTFITNNKARSTDNNSEVIQMHLPSIKEYLHYIDKAQDQEVQLKKIEDYLILYHIAKMQPQPHYQKLMKRLDELEKSIFQWFDIFKSGDLKKVTNAPFLLKLLKDVENEHMLLVDFSVQNPKNFIPVNISGMSQETIAKVYQIWNSIVANNGNIMVLGTTDFQKKTYAQLAKLLQGEYGRSMLEYLDGGEVKSSNTISISSDFSSKLAKANMTDQEPEGSYALPRESLLPDETNNSNITVTDNNLGYDEVDNLNALNQAMMEGRPGVMYNGKSYTFGSGSGSYVKMVDEGDRPDINANLQQILSPGFIALGHELGHAMRNRGGGSFNNLNTASYEHLLESEEGRKDEDTRGLWTNAEELTNINTVENNIRGEHQLSSRSYHASEARARNLKFVRRLTEIYTTPLNNLEKQYVRSSAIWMNNIQPAIDYQNWTDEYFQTAMADLVILNTEIVPEAKRRAHAKTRLETLKNDYSSILNARAFDQLPDVRDINALIIANPYQPIVTINHITTLEANLKSTWFKSMAKKGLGYLLGAIATAGSIYIAVTTFKDKGKTDL